MTDIGKRLRKLRVELDFNQGEFAERIGIVQSALSAIESGRKPLTDRNFKLICLTFRVNETWLRTGEGEMLLLQQPKMAIPKPDTPIIGPDGEILEGYEAELIEMYDKLFPETQRKILEYIREKLELQELRGKSGGEGKRADTLKKPV